MNDFSQWSSIYDYWKIAVSIFPELQKRYECIEAPVHRKAFGRLYYYDWCPADHIEEKLQETLLQFYESYCDIGGEWSKGAQHTACLLCLCQNVEEQAAVWINAFVLNLEQKNGITPETRRNLCTIQDCTLPVILKNYENWSAWSKNFFPEFYFPQELLYDKIDLSIPALLHLAAMNASMVLAHYRPVAYKIVFDEQ